MAGVDLKTPGGGQVTACAAALQLGIGRFRSRETESGFIGEA